MKPGIIKDDLNLGRGWLLGNRKRGPSHFNLGPAVQEYIDGLILSDAWVCPHGYGARFGQSFSPRYFEWAEQIYQDFNDFGILGRMRLKIHNGYGPYNYKYEFDSFSYYELKSFRERWYPKGIKVVPQDIVLSPSCVANWYMGDGSLLKTIIGKKKIQDLWNPPTIHLATRGFNADDTIMLKEMLQNILSLSRVSLVDVSKYLMCGKARRFDLAISRRSDVLKFLNYSSAKVIPPCFEYKFEHQLNLPNPRRPYSNVT